MFRARSYCQVLHEHSGEGKVLRVTPHRLRLTTRDHLDFIIVQPNNSQQYVALGLRLGSFFTDILERSGLCYEKFCHGVYNRRSLGWTNQNHFLFMDFLGLIVL